MVQTCQVVECSDFRRLVFRLLLLSCFETNIRPNFQLFNFGGDDNPLYAKIASNRLKLIKKQNQTKRLKL